MMRVSWHRLIWWGLFFSLVGSVHTAFAAATVGDIDAYLAKHGPQQTISKFFSCSGGLESEQSFALVESGAPRAVRLAFKLQRSADGCYSEGLLAAIETAMRNNPAAVLPYMGTQPNNDADALCTSEMLIEPTDAELLAALERTRIAVESVNQPTLAVSKRACLRAIAKAQKQIRENSQTH